MSNAIQNSKLHKYAYEGKKSKLKQFIKDEFDHNRLNINILDQDGKTALYYACLRDNKDCVKLLLENHANPNERCSNDETAVHAAAANGHIKIMLLLLEYGGDLRLHDKQNRTPKTWAMQQQNPTLRRKMLAFIEEARMNAQMIQIKKVVPEYMITPKSSEDLVNPVSVGFGILYKTNHEIGVPIVLPAVKEEEMSHDYSGETFYNGAFMVYESMKWKEANLVTVKRLQSNLLDAGQSDYLIEELKYYKKINHCPNILSLMGFCQCENSDSLILMFERIQCGSLFSILHEREMTKYPKLKSICQIMMNVCDALMYLHQQNIVHCYVSSHSIMLTNFHTAKLANLEYCVEKTELTKQKRSKIIENQMLNCAYNWLAPELMQNEHPSELSDMYSFCVVIWELFNVEIPWAGLKWTEIKHELLVRGNSLPVNFDKIPIPFSRIIKDGFSDPIKRMNFEEVRSALENLMISIHTQQVSKSKVNRLYERKKDSDVSKIKNNSFSEGIASINEVVSNEMETLNSMEEFDKFSELSSESFIHCDAYKAEIHLTKGKSKNIEKPNKKLPPTPHKQTPPLPSTLITPSPTPNPNINKRIVSKSVDSPNRKSSTPTQKCDIFEKFSKQALFQVDLKEEKKTPIDLMMKQHEKKIDRENPFRNHKFDEFSNNISNPTPDDKKRYLTNPSKATKLEHIDPKTPIQKLNYSNLSQEDNTAEKTPVMEKRIFNPTPPPPPAPQPPRPISEFKNNRQMIIEELKQKQEQRYQSSSDCNMTKSGSYNHLAEELRYHLFGVQEQNRPQVKTQFTRSLSSNPPNTKKSSSFTIIPHQEHKSRRQAVGSSSLQSNEFFAGHGSVKSLVQSYEENSAKEKNELNSKIEQIRLERLKELYSAVEQGRNLDKKEEETDKKQVQQSKYCIQKELSTISERTEQSCSFNNQNLINSTIESPIVTNLNSNSKATTVTKSIRHLNQQNFLDSSTGASGDGLSKNLSNLNSSTPIQLNNLNTTTSNVSINFNSTKKQDSSEQLISENVLNINQANSTIIAIQNLKKLNQNEFVSYKYTLDRKYKYSSQLNEESSNDEEEEDSSESENEANYTPEGLIHIGPLKDKSSLNSPLQNKTISNTNNYSSQEDFLSSIHPGETSIECSENVYLNDFDKLAYESNQKISKFLNKNNSPEAVRIPVNIEQATTSKQVNNKNVNFNSKKNKSESSSSIPAAISVPSLNESTSMDSAAGVDNADKNKKIANVRMDKHVIDTTKFVGYQYKLETRSNVSNQYHIKGLLTNEQTGHQLVVTNTKVQTPKILTRVIIDQ